MRAAFVAISGSDAARAGITAGFGRALLFDPGSSATSAAWGVALPAANPAGNFGRGGKLLAAGTGTTGQISTRGARPVPETVLKVSVPFAWRFTYKSDLSGSDAVAFS